MSARTWLSALLVHGKRSRESLCQQGRIGVRWRAPSDDKMRLAYNILFIVFFWLSAPFYFLKMWRRGNWRDGFGQRFGRFSPKVKQAMTNRHVVWIHGVSVGEVNVAM